jgi:ribosomal protein L37E
VKPRARQHGRRVWSVWTDDPWRCGYGRTLEHAYHAWQMARDLRRAAQWSDA